VGIRKPSRARGNDYVAREHNLHAPVMQRPFTATMIGLRHLSIAVRGFSSEAITSPPRREASVKSMPAVKARSLLIEKPFAPAQLLTAVAQLLNKGTT
jgi:hypothetical protein